MLRKSLGNKDVIAWAHTQAPSYVRIVPGESGHSDLFRIWWSQFRDPQMLSPWSIPHRPFENDRLTEDPHGHVQ